MENSCRTCLKEKRLNSMKLLSAKWNDTLLSFADMLMDIVNMNKEITSDETSFRICSSCELDLITAYNFKIVCQNTEKILAEKLTKTIIELPPIVIEEIKCETIIDDFSDNLDETISNDLIEKCKEQPDQTSSDIEIKPKIKTSLKKTINKQSKKKPKKLNINIKSNENKEEENVNSLDILKLENKSLMIGKKSGKRRNCRKCNLTFEEQKLYRKHRRDVHKDSTGNRKESRRKNRKPSVYCKRCDVKFEEEKFYRKHCEDMHWQKLACTICGKLYLENRLKSHVLIHATERTHVCTYCGAKFVSNTNLQEHLRIHTGEKRYKCSYCGETFIHWNTRKNHIVMVHTKEKKYECYICHKLFAQRGQMVLHIKYHLGDLRHPCSFCDKRFPHSYALKRHELTHFTKRKTRVCKKKIIGENIDDVSKAITALADS